MQHITKYRELSTSTGKVYLSIYYDEQNNWIYNNWVGYVTPENVKQGSLAVLEAFKTYKTPFGLNDNTELVGRWDQSVDWIAQEWMPKAVEAGLRCYALVVDKEAFAAASALEMQNRAEGQFTMRLFEHITEAKEWLHSCAQKNS